VVCDNYATHKHPNLTAWLAKHPRVQLHFTPTSGSWLNMVEIFLRIITRQAIRRATFHSVKDLETAIGNYIDGWNERAHPFTWTKNGPRHHRPRQTLNQPQEDLQPATLVLRVRSLLTLGFGEDGVRVFGPDERCAPFVPAVDEGSDGSLEVADGVERAAPDRLLGDDPEEDLDHVQP